MSDNINYDELLAKVASKEPKTPPKEKKPKFKFSKKIKTIIAISISILILAVIFIRYRHNVIEEKAQEQRQIALAKKKKAQKEKKKAQKIESQYLLSKSQYESNIKTLVDANMGFVRDEEKGLVGKIKFSSGMTAEILDYSRKTGEIHAIDDKFNPVTYDDSWVNTLIAKINATKSNNKLSSEQEQNNDKENSQETKSSSEKGN